MAERYIIDGFWDRKNLLGLNNNFEKLFNNVISTLNDVSDLKNKINTKIYNDEMSFNFIFRDLETVKSLNDNAQEAVNKAIEVNKENKNVQTQIDELILDKGKSDAEVVQARVDANGISSNTLKERIDKLQNTVKEASQKSALYEKIYNTPQKFTLPSDLKVNIPFAITITESGNTSIDYDNSINKNSVTKTYYVDVKTGSNTAAGTQSAPFKSINRALRYGDADEIIVNEGVYGWTDGFSGFSQTKPFNLIGQGTVIIGAHRDNLAWIKNSTYSNVYQTTATSVVELIDYKDVKNIRIMNKQTSLQGVSENKNSYYIDSSNILYVRTYDDRVPDERIFPNLSSDAAKITDNPKVYFENLVFSNTVRLTATSNNKQFFAKNCQFSIGTGNNALSVEGYDYNILQNCIATLSTMDGFNYHIANNIVPKVIEIDCKGFNNGRNGADQNNGSTSHDGSQILRICGEYYNNGGPNVIDVNEGTVSVNIGVYSHNSRATKGTISNASFKNGNVGASKMYLVNCVTTGSDYSLVTATSQSSNTVVQNSLLLEKQNEV